MNENISKSAFSPWMRGFLMLGSVYTLAWGVFIYNFPQEFYQWISGQVGESPGKIQNLGLLVLSVSGIFAASAWKPEKSKLYLILLIILKLTGGIVMFYFFLDQNISKRFYFHLLMNDLVWVPPLFLVLRCFWKSRIN